LNMLASESAPPRIVTIDVDPMHLM
jgi:hypothetical protein